MTPERWRQIEELYHAARERGPEERKALLAQACRGDAELREKVESLLAQEDPNGNSLLGQPGSLIDEPTQTVVEPGAQLGPYKIEALIGAGGMGQVYRAIDTRLGRKVAIKICAQQFSGRFEREARAISSLNHPNICTLYDVGPNYLVMELVEGETLAARLQKGRQPMVTVLRYAAEIAGALAAAHAVGIVHRDLKPQNIMIAKSGAKVLDFGLAKSPQYQALTASRVVMGTPAYMAPEQLEGKECDARSDIYALGLVLHEMAVGKRLPQGQPPLMGGLPPQFAHVIERCLQAEPENRWQSASDVKWELEWAAETQVTTQATESRKGRPRWIWGVAVSMLLLGLWLGWTIAHLRHPVAGTRTAEQPLVRLDVALGPGVSLGRQAGVILSPDGTRLVYASQNRLFTLRLDQPKTIELAGTEGAFAPFFSPDGQWVAFFARGKLTKVSVEGGTPIVLCDAVQGRGGSWGEDGNIVAALNAGDALSRIPSSGGTPTPVTELARGEFTHRWPQILPGGKAVMFTANTNSGWWIRWGQNRRHVVQGSASENAAAGRHFRPVSSHVKWDRPPGLHQQGNPVCRAFGPGQVGGARHAHSAVTGGRLQRRNWVLAARFLANRNAGVPKRRSSRTVHRPMDGCGGQDATAPIKNRLRWAPQPVAGWAATGTDDHGKIDGRLGLRLAPGHHDAPDLRRRI